MKASRLFVMVAALFVVALGAPGAHAGSRAISVRDSYFATKYLVITVGDSVTWTNDGDNGHTVTAFDGSYDSSPRSIAGVCDDGNPLTPPLDCLAPGDTFQHTYNRAGTFDYYCKIHGNSASAPDPSAAATDQPCGMCARIQVKAKSSPTVKPSVTVNPTPTRSASPSPSPSPSPSASPSPSPTASSTEAAGPAKSSGSSKALIAVLGIVLLGGAGYGVWRRYLAPR